MMQRIKIIVDTPCDITDEELKKYEIGMVGVPITVDGVGYIERESFTCEEFYPILEAAKSLPTTSRVPFDSFLEKYEEAWDDGYTDVIVITLNAGGSAINESAQMAAKQFFEEVSGAVNMFAIHIVDSMTYSIAYGYPAIRAAMMAKEQKSVDDILNYLCDVFSRTESCLVCYTLDYAKKSGRITAAAALAGTLLGLRPTIAMIDGETTITAKSRGDRTATKNLIETYLKRRVSADDPALVVSGSTDAYGRMLRKQLEDELHRGIPHYKAGAAITINAGPRMAALCFLSEKRALPDHIKSLVVTVDGK